MGNETPKKLANTILLKRGPNVPPNGSLQEGELGFSTSEKALYVGAVGDDGHVTPHLLQAATATITTAFNVDWNDTNQESPGFIRNKPDIAGIKKDIEDVEKDVVQLRKDVNNLAPGGGSGGGTVVAGGYKTSVKEYGAVGNGEADDTKAF
jgi:hypothetical protein